MAEKKDKKQKKNDAGTEHNQDDLIGQLQKDLEESQKLQEESLAKAQRALADYSNLKKRFDKEREEIGKYASELLLLRLLPAIDNLDRAVFYASDEEKKSSLFMGVKMTLQQLHEQLELVGFSKIDAKVGDEFDPHVHEAVEMVDGPETKVVEVMQPGYKLEDKVVRPAQVKVGSGT